MEARPRLTLPAHGEGGARRVVVLSYFLVFLGAGVYLPYFPLYLAHLGFGGWQIGVIVGMQPALRWTSALGWAWAADRWRMRRRLLVLAAVGGTLCFVPLLVAREFATVALACAAIGILHGPLIPMLDATVIDHLPRLGDDYGRLRLWGSVSFVIGALASAPLVVAFSPSVVPLLLFLPAIGLGPALARLPAEQAGPAWGAPPPWALLTPALRAFLATAFLLQVSSGAWAGFFAVHTTALGFSVTVPGFTWGLAVMGEIGLFFWGRRLGAWLAPPQLILLVLGVTVVRWGLTAFARSEPLVVGLQLGHAVTFSAFHLAAVLLLARLVPPESSTGGQALYGGIAFGLGGTLGLGLAGALVDRIGTSALFGLEAVAALLAVPPALRLRRLVAGRHAGAIALAVCLGALFWFGLGLRASFEGDVSPAAVQAWVGSLGWRGPGLYVGLLVFRQFLLLPAALLLPVGGLCFGAVLGTLLGTAGIVLSAALKFGVARAVGRRWLRSRLGGRFRRLEARVERLGPALVGVATAHPVGPLSPLHWGAGLSSMAASAFLVAVAIGAPVRAFAYAFFGSAVDDPGSTHFLAASALLGAGTLLPLLHPGFRRRVLGRRATAAAHPAAAP
jgi:PPP family 3-phenylpropionic acid transporter